MDAQPTQTPEPIKAKVRNIALERNQLSWAPQDLQCLIPEDHPARIIWQIGGRLKLTRFEDAQQCREGNAGRPCWPAQALICVWIYSYTLGVASARAIERMMSHEPGLRWLTADQKINHHTLSDFRVGHRQALEDLFTQFLAVLETAGVVNLKTLLQDGTKVRAVAGKASMRRRKTLEKQLRQARQVVRKLDREATEDEAMDRRREAAQKRAARQALERAEAALQRLEEKEKETPPSQRADLRVSASEPEAQKMKHPDGSFAPSYNVQITTEIQSRMIVAVAATTATNDVQELLPAIERAERNCGARPAQMIADNGYATRSNVQQCSAQGVELIAPWKDDTSRAAGACARNGIAPEFAPSAFKMQRGGQALTCPAGKTLVVIQQKVHHGLPRDVFRANAKDCGRCRWRAGCCGQRKGPRQVAKVVESAAMKKYLARMKRPEIRKLYQKRGEVAEFPHMWFKAVKGFRRFSGRGVVKAGMEALWVALSYNIAQWLRLRPMTIATT